MTEAGLTVLISTHDPDYAFSWADQIILFHQGRVLKSGSLPIEVFSDQAALTLTNLSRPAVLSMYGSLCRKKIINTGIPIPKNLMELEQIIEGI